MYLTLHGGDGMHLGYGRRAVDVADYQGAQNAFALVIADDGSILTRIENKSAGEFTCGAWCADGWMLLSTSTGFIMKYSIEGEEIWRRDLRYISNDNKEVRIEDEVVRILAIQDMLPIEGGHLLAINTDDAFARMIEVDQDGYITRDWMESIGDFASTDSLQLFRRDDSIYLLTSGLVMDEMKAYEAGMTLAEIPRKYTFKAITAAN